jgi:UPF0716 protein FxsA
MSLLGRLFLLFVGVPLLELFILVQVGQMVGVLPTIGFVVLTGVVGAALARLEGLRTMWKLRSELTKGRLPSGALMDGAAILVGGALLLTPGILTDIVGFSFLLPPTRKVIMKRIRKGLEGRLKSGAIRITHMGGMAGAGAQNWGAPEEWPDGQPNPSGEIVIDVNDIAIEGDESEGA